MVTGSFAVSAPTVIETTLPPVRPPASHRRAGVIQINSGTAKIHRSRLWRECSTAARELGIYLCDGFKFGERYRVSPGAASLPNFSFCRSQIAQVRWLADRGSALPR